MEPSEPATNAEVEVPSDPITPKEKLESGKHLVIRENEIGHTFEKLFGPYLEGARKITVNDAY
ncbi:MAG: hypothetical protein VW683_13220, partial [Betaproteobacteria bacterium]